MSLLKIDWATHEAAKYACEHWHYSGCIPKSKLAKYGVWEDGKFIGVVIYGVGATGDLVKRYGLKPEQGCELVRVALTTHETPVTRIIAITLKMLKKTFTGLRVVVSFADPEHGHVGGIYQGGGWMFTGTTGAHHEYLVNGVRYHHRSFAHKFKNMLDHQSVTKIKGSSKYRYIMPLDTEMLKQIEPLRKPYPKKCVSSICSDVDTVQVLECGASPTETLQK